MDYEEFNKSCLEEARKLYQTANADQKYVLEKLFPELAESEDEKVRKEIIATIHLYYGEPLEDEAKEMIAWLEKQKEQKSADKPESRFKVGDWVINTSGDVNQITKDYGDGFTLDNNVYLSDSWAAKHYRLWTIQDAKDGDVLAYNDSKNNVYVCIYKEYANERVYDYCALDKESFWEHGNWNYLASFSYTPATKEQRDLLFQKMKEAGYEWDVEKKELKHIFDIEIPYGAKDSELQEVSYHIPEGFHAEIEGNKVIIKQGEQKPAWSEKDERMLCDVISYAEHEISFKNTPQLNWLKSLKDRYTWKPNDGQMEALKGVQEGVFRLGILKSLYQDLKKLKEE